MTDFKPYPVGEYLIDRPLTADGAGFCRWGTALRGGRRFFLKEFLSPKYPAADAQITQTQRERKIQECLHFYNQRSAVYERLLTADRGNLIAPLDFFKAQSRFYLVTQYIPPCPYTLLDAAQFPPAQRLLLLRIIANEFDALDQAGVVHSDVKTENFLLKQTLPGCYTVKVIDFDAGFCTENPPDPEDMNGDQLTCAPETLIYLMGGEGQITTKADIFSLGIVFHEVLTGTLPAYEGAYNYLCEAVLDGAQPLLSPMIGNQVQSLLSQMLLADPAARPSAGEVLQKLMQMEPHDLPQTYQAKHEKQEA